MQDHEIIFKDFLKSRDMKLTRPRKILLDTIFAHEQHLDVETLYDIIRRDYNNISMATIYRNLPLLVESGLIRQSVRSESKYYYEHIHGEDNHLHFVCLACGKIIEVQSIEIDTIMRKLAEDNNMELQSYNLETRVLCDECAGK